MLLQIRGRKEKKISVLFGFFSRLCFGGFFRSYFFSVTYLNFFLGCLDAESQLKFLEALKALNQNANKFIDACKRARIQKNDRNAVNDMEGKKKKPTKKNR